MPSLVARTPLSSSMPLRSTRTFGRLMRSLSQSKLSSPPAMTQASAPCCCKSFCASLMVHRAASFERCENGVRVYGSTLKDFVTQRIGKRIQNRRAAAAYRRFADAARSRGRFRIRNIQRFPLHVHRHVQNGWRLGVVKALGDHDAVVGIENPLLTNSVADTERRTAQDLSAERGRMDYAADVRVRKKINNVVMAGFNVHFDFGETRDVGVRDPIARIVVTRGGNQSLAGQRDDRCFGEFVDVRGSFVAIRNSAKLYC